MDFCLGLITLVMTVYSGLLSWFDYTGNMTVYIGLLSEFDYTGDDCLLWIMVPGLITMDTPVYSGLWLQWTFVLV